MKFKLVYRGQVKINPKKRTKHIHDLREKFSEQMRTLFEITPYNELKQYIRKDQNKKSIIKTVGGVDFISLITPELNLLAELDIQLLLPELAQTPRADIDNRMKTLLDGLRRPQDIHEIPENIDKSQPIFTLLDDDRYVSKLIINTTHLLNQENEDDIMVIITVNIRATKATLENINYLI